MLFRSTITIATSDGSGKTADLSTIEEAAAAVDTTTLTAAISEVTVAAGLPPVVVSGLQPSVQATAEIEVPFACPAGKWCTAGLVVDCPLGTYNPLEDQDFATACVMCPINSYTVRTGATSRSDCVCDSDFYDANATTDIDWALLANLNEVKNDPRNIGNAIVQARVNRYLAIVSRNTSAAVINCQVCPYGTNCMQGETLEALPLVRGFFRVGDDSTDVRKCPDADANCSVTFGTEACVSASGCIGGTDATALCASGLSGTFCRTCINDQAELLSFYVKADEIQEAHCRECGNNLAMSAFMAIVVLCGFGVAAALLVRLKRKPSFAYVMATFTPDNKLKNLIGFYMVATKIDVIYDVALPADVRAVLRRSEEHTSELQSP